MTRVNTYDDIKLGVDVLQPALGIDEGQGGHPSVDKFPKRVYDGGFLRGCFYIVQGSNTHVT